MGIVKQKQFVKKIKNYKCLLFIMAMLLVVITSCTVDPDWFSYDPISDESSSKSVTLEWDPADGDVSGYKLYYGNESRNYDNVIDVGNTTVYTVDGLEDGKVYYFSATSYNDEGLESDFSNEVSYEVQSDNT